MQQIEKSQAAVQQNDKSATTCKSCSYKSGASRCKHLAIFRSRVRVRARETPPIFIKCRLIAISHGDNFIKCRLIELSHGDNFVKCRLIMLSHGDNFVKCRLIMLSHGDTPSVAQALQAEAVAQRQQQVAAVL